MQNETFILLRNLSFFFATAMLFKYYLFMMIAPFYTVKEKFRKAKILANRIKNGTKEYNPLVTIVIPAWNEEVGVTKSVDTLLKNTYKNIEIIVVNDGSTDETNKVVNRYLGKLSEEQREKIKYYAKKNGGKGTALNFGIKKANGEILITMDADSAFDKKAIEAIVSYFEDPSIDAVVGNVKVANNRTLIGSIQQLEYLFGFYFKRAHAVMGAEYIFGGACAAFRMSSTFEKHGTFDTKNKTEDIEMSMRLRFHGVKCTYAEDAICYTEGASTILGLLNQRLRWKKGRFDTFIQYRRMFFSLKKKHNWFLSWIVLPYSMLAEIQLIFEPIAITLLAAYSFISGDFLSLSLGSLFIFTIYLVNALFSHQGLNLKLIPTFFVSWILFYFLVWIEFLALIKSIIVILRGDDIEWQSWERVGVGKI